MPEPRRIAHAVHALIVASQEHGMPVTASEVMVYDQEALSPRATGSALQRARTLGLAMNAGRYWIPTNAALERTVEFEDRFLADTEARL